MTTPLPRITARVDSETQALLSQAAAVSGLPSINSFVLSAAVEKAKKIIEQEQSLKLTERDSMMLLNALDANAKPHARLQLAVQKYDAKTQS